MILTKFHGKMTKVLPQTSYFEKFQLIEVGKSNFIPEKCLFQLMSIRETATDLIDGLEYLLGGMGYASEIFLKDCGL